MDLKRKDNKMILRKWNNKEHTYEPYEIPDDWNCKTYSNDMEEIINCPHCGRKLKFGDYYTSIEIHTDIGFGYGVCRKCYQDEWTRRNDNEL